MQRVRHIQRRFLRESVLRFANGDRQITLLIRFAELSPTDSVAEQMPFSVYKKLHPTMFVIPELTLNPSISIDHYFRDINARRLAMIGIGTWHEFHSTGSINTIRH